MMEGGREKKQQASRWLQSSKIHYNVSENGLFGNKVSNVLKNMFRNQVIVTSHSDSGITSLQIILQTPTVLGA